MIMLKKKIDPGYELFYHKAVEANPTKGGMEPPPPASLDVFVNPKK